MHAWLDQQSSAKYKAKHCYGPDKQLCALVLNFSNINQQRLAQREYECQTFTTPTLCTIQ